jgi:hypothetical protein
VHLRKGIGLPFPFHVQYCSADMDYRYPFLKYTYEERLRSVQYLYTEQVHFKTILKFRGILKRAAIKRLMEKLLPAFLNRQYVFFFQLIFRKEEPYRYRVPTGTYSLVCRPCYDYKRVKPFILVQLDPG